MQCTWRFLPKVFLKQTNTSNTTTISTLRKQEQRQLFVTKTFAEGHYLNPQLRGFLKSLRAFSLIREQSKEAFSSAEPLISKIHPCPHSHLSLAHISVMTYADGTTESEKVSFSLYTHAQFSFIPKMDKRK